VTWHNQFLPDTDRELAQIAPAFSKCSHSAIQITAELFDGSDRNKKGGTLGGLNNSRICAKICAFYGNNDGISKNRRYFEKTVFFQLLVRAVLSLRKASTSPGADWCE
jgi:hypothetical protein